MAFSFHRLYRNSSFLISAIGVVVAFLLLARGYSGYAFDRQKLNLLCDMILSSGLFLVGLPLIASLVLPEKKLEDRRSAFLQRLAFGLQISGLSLSMLFIFSFDNPGYVGFIQLPEQGRVVFILALMSSTLSALAFIAERLTSAKKEFISGSVLPTVLLFSACGLALSLLTLQTVEVMSSEVELYTATIPINEFFRQILIVAALSAFISRLIEESTFQPKKFLIFANAVSGTFLMVGFQSSALNESSNDWLFLLNQGASTIGISGFIWLSGTLIFKSWRSNGRHFADTGIWVSHSIFLLALFFTLILQVGVGRILFSFGVLDNLRLALLIFAAPLTMIRLTDHKPLYSQFCRSLVSVLNWCGLFMTAVSLLIVAPYGGSLSGIGHESFRAFYGIAMVGLFMLAISYAVILWDKILGEAI